MDKNIKNIVYIAISSALICLATLVIRIPMPLTGYVNFGDGVIIALANHFGAMIGIAAALGSGLADLIAGYPIYIPATAIIKGLVALIICLPHKKDLPVKELIIRAVIAEAVMVLGYFIYESILYSPATAATAILGNTIQGLFAIVLGSLLYTQIKKIKL